MPVCEVYLEEEMHFFLLENENPQNTLPVISFYFALQNDGGLCRSNLSKTSNLQATENRELQETASEQWLQNFWTQVLSIDSVQVAQPLLENEPCSRSPGYLSAFLVLFNLHRHAIASKLCLKINSTRNDLNDSCCYLFLPLPGG
jgi:hypothetical protein